MQEFLALYERLSLKEMSVQYWPSEGTKKYSSVTVTLLDEMTLQDYVIRKFELCHAENKVLMIQLAV
jgi:hypothetical protein